MASQQLYRVAEKALYNYHKHVATVKMYETKNILRGRGEDGAGGVKTSGKSDPTAQAGIALAAPTPEERTAKRWVWAIETAWAELTAYAPEKAKLMEKYYGLNDMKDRPKKQQPFVRENLMIELSISYKTFYNWKNDCVDAVVHAAIQCGALTPYKMKTPV